MIKYYTISPIFNPNGIGSGFFSNYKICLEKLINYHKSGNDAIPYITWANTTFVEGFNPVFVGDKLEKFTGENMIFDERINPFDLWFDQENPYDLAVQKENIIISPINRPNNTLDHSKHYFNEPEQLKYQQEIDKLYIKPKQYILDKIESIYDNEFKNEIVLGVMARGSEYDYWHGNIYGVFGVQDYIREIDKILNENPEITKLFLVSDETDYINELYKAFPNSYFMPDVFRRTDETMEYINRVPYWMNVSNKRENHCNLLGQEVIIQAKLLGKSDYLFGRMSGVLAGSVLWNENLKKVQTL